MTDRQRCDMNGVRLTAMQLERLRRIASEGPLPVGTRTTHRVIGESGVRSLERRGLVLRFTVNPKRVSGMVRVTELGREVLTYAAQRLPFDPNNEGVWSAAQSAAG